MATKKQQAAMLKGLLDEFGGCLDLFDQCDVDHYDVRRSQIEHYMSSLRDILRFIEAPVNERDAYGSNGAEALVASEFHRKMQQRETRIRRLTESEMQKALVEEYLMQKATSTSYLKAHKPKRGGKRR